MTLNVPKMAADLSEKSTFLTNLPIKDVSKTFDYLFRGYLTHFLFYSSFGIFKY